MFLKVQLPWNVAVPAESLDESGQMLKKAIVRQLLDDFATRKADKDVGYFVAVTTLDSIGEGKIRLHTGEVVFPVVFSGITFKLLKGEVLEGVVRKVIRYGVLLQCGPAENIYLPGKKMPDYQYVHGENPMFLNEKLGCKIEKDAVVRFSVIASQWLPENKEFQALVGLNSD